MSDLISRQAAIELWEQYHPYIAVKACEYGKRLRSLPSAERRGRWVKGDEMADYPRVPYKPWETYCSCCGGIKEQINDNFCGNCGASMYEVEE